MEKVLYAFCFLLQVFLECPPQKNNHGNIPLHYAAHYNAHIEVVEALYHAFPEAAWQKNYDSNLPLDLAVADGAPINVGGGITAGQDRATKQGGNSQGCQIEV